jgi:hypothetical protein
VYEQKLASGDQAAADIVKGISPNAWQHVHLIGAFDFALSALPRGRIEDRASLNP